jgi:hypothetical protein
MTMKVGLSFSRTSRTIPAANLLEDAIRAETGAAF